MRGGEAAIARAQALPVQLMNTLTVGAGGDVLDALADDAAAGNWLRQTRDQVATEAGITSWPEGPALAEVSERLRELRDALRCLAADVTHDPRPPLRPMSRSEATAALNAMAGAWPELGWGDGGRPVRTFRAAGAPHEVYAGYLAHEAVELFAGSRLALLRACLAPNCLHFFLRDRSRREWCSTTCGNRARVARHYERHAVSRRPERG